MTTQTTLAKMARAHDAEDAAQRGEPDPWSIEGDGFAEFRASRLDAMRAALQALREPTDGVVSALDMEILTEGVSGEDCRRAFVAAIDAILQEKA